MKQILIDELRWTEFQGEILLGPSDKTLWYVYVVSYVTPWLIPRVDKN